MTILNRIAFGSCNEQNAQNNMWAIIEKRKSAAFIWGGDAIYAGMKTKCVTVYSACMSKNNGILPN